MPVKLEQVFNLMPTKDMLQLVSVINKMFDCWNPCSTDESVLCQHTLCSSNHKTKIIEQSTDK